jgi:hypothetical protein
MNPIERPTEWNGMVILDCPWCAQEAMVEAAESDLLVCEACGVQASLAPDPVVDRIALAA